ncbi:MAG TPA: prolyl oligopeptidase family serine peptidase, partial [Steroidobacteraceae bacterium]|nr:prolyl oligopeptidase family serine peptidase [Steroidobacteraceae bacterium]
SVALLLATRGSAAARQRPAAVIVSGACADPLSAGSDGYFRKQMAAQRRDPAEYSPYAQVRGGLPPVLAVHATADEFCPYPDMEKFAARYRAAGNTIDLISIEGVSHFFGFYDEQGKRRQAEAIRASLGRWDW